MRQTLLAAGSAFTFLVVAVGPAAAASTKYEFEPVTFSDGTVGTVYAAVKDHNNKPDHFQCTYVDSGHQFLGYYNAFLEEQVSSDPAVIRDLCLDNYANRTR